MTLPATTETDSVVTDFPEQERRKQPLSDSVRSTLGLYFKNLNGHPPQNIYDMVMSEVERPLLQMAMQYTKGNQTKAASMLGINRTTLRKKLKHYGLD